MSDGLGFGAKRLIEKIVETHWGIKDPNLKKFTFTELLFIMQEFQNEEGKAYQEQKNIHRGHYIFKEFVKLILYRNLANYDSMVLLSSEKGTGKSSAGIMLCREWCKLIGIRFNPERHIAYTNADVMNKVDSLQKFEPILCDEAVLFATAAEWAKTSNKELKKKLAQVRTKHLLFILCFPMKIQKIESTYLDSFVNYWIDLFGRGVGAVYVKDRNPAHDAWRIKDFQKLGSYTEFTSPSQVEKVLKKHPNFWQIIKFPKPPGWLYKRYLKVREKNVYDDQNVLKSVSKEDIHRALLIMALRDIMMHDTTLSMNRIILHIKNEYDINITKGMVQSAVDDAKQLVSKVREQALEV